MLARRHWQVLLAVHLGLPKEGTSYLQRLQLDLSWHRLGLRGLESLLLLLPHEGDKEGIHSINGTIGMRY
jgi:hypothetical protein